MRAIRTEVALHLYGTEHKYDCQLNMQTPIYIACLIDTISKSSPNVFAYVFADYNSPVFILISFFKQVMQFHLNFEIQNRTTVKNV